MRGVPTATASPGVAVLLANRRSLLHLRLPLLVLLSDELAEVDLLLDSCERLIFIVVDHVDTVLLLMVFFVFFLLFFLSLFVVMNVLLVFLDVDVRCILLSILRLFGSCLIRVVNLTYLVKQCSFIE